jgi:hypothetical protein
MRFRDKDLNKPFFFIPKSYVWLVANSEVPSAEATGIRFRAPSSLLPHFLLPLPVFILEISLTLKSDVRLISISCSRF